MLARADVHTVGTIVHGLDPAPQALPSQTNGFCEVVLKYNFKLITEPCTLSYSVHEAKSANAQPANTTRNYSLRACCLGRWSYPNPL